MSAAPAIRGTLRPDVRAKDPACERCGVRIIRLRRKVRGLILCNSCKYDRWFIDKAGRADG